MVRKEAWNLLREAYKPEGLTIPHQYQVGDAVLVRRYCVGNLEPWWKGPYLVLMTIPTTIKVEGISAWIHASHVKKAPEQSQDEWDLETTNNPLKLCLHCRWDKTDGQDQP